MKHLPKYIFILVFLVLSVLYVIKFGGPSTLKLYVESGFGDCHNNPVLCARPDPQEIVHEIDREYLRELIPYRFLEMELRLPKGFTVAKEKVRKVYYKKYKRNDKGATAYLLYEPPEFFLNLFPQTKKEGMSSDYDFLARIMNASIESIKTVNDAFFVITKGVFVPDLGTQKNLKMVKFSLDGKKGFINYNLDGQRNYFDCNIFDAQDNFFKIYIKDTAAQLDLGKVLSIVSTVRLSAQSP